MKTILKLILLLSVKFTYSQDFPGRYYNLLIDKELKVKEYKLERQNNAFFGFYKDEKLTKIYKEGEKGYTEYNSIVGKIFKVESTFITNNEKNEEQIILKLKNEETGYIYYKYNKSSRASFVLKFEIIGGIILPDDFYCDKITMKEDKFTKNIRFSSEEEGGISFVKLIEADKETVYMLINGYGKTLTIDANGFIILFSDGTKFEKPNLKFTVEYSNKKSYYGDYIYSSIITLSKEEIELFKEKLITDYRIYIYDSSVKSKQNILLREYLKCLTKVNK